MFGNKVIACFSREIIKRLKVERFKQSVEFSKCKELVQQLCISISKQAQIIYSEIEYHGISQPEYRILKGLLKTLALVDLRNDETTTVPSH